MRLLKLELTRGGFAIIDTSDYDTVRGRNWRLSSGGGYAVAHFFPSDPISGGVRCVVSMHRVIMGLSRGDPREVDHINGNRLDNRRANLRIVTHQQNMMNRANQINNTSGYKGVGFHVSSGLWRARIKLEGRSVNLGYFATPEEAYVAYCEAAPSHHGEFARLA